MISVVDKYGNKKGIGLQGPAGPAGPSSNTTNIIASQVIPAYVPITIGGEVANSGNILHLGKVVGICTQLTLSNFSAPVQIGSTLSNNLWNWTQGDIIYVGNGVLTSTPPVSGWSQIIGEALNSSTILINIKYPILL